MAPMREVKLCLLGEAGVGKSSLVLRFVSDTFNPNNTSTIGASFMSKSFVRGEETIKFQIWDTAGQEKYKALAPMYYRGSHAAIVVYDLTLESTFESLKRWVRELQQHGPPNIIIAIAANKCDLIDGREVEKTTGEEYAQSINAVFSEVSALTAHNVNELFEQISQRLPLEQPTSYLNPQLGSRLQDKKEEKEKKCC